jgi:inosose dehydratase
MNGRKQMKLGYHTNTWGGVVGHPAGVGSVKDLYYLTPGSTERALADIAAAGYRGCELFDGNLVEYDDRRDELRRLLGEHGLELIAVYAGANFIFGDILADELWRLERGAEIAADLGAEHLVVGGGAQRAGGEAPGDLDRLAEGLGAVQELAARHGLTPSYHPHLGTMVQAPDALDALMERTSIGLCPDTAHLAAGGGDAAAIIRRYGDRIPYVHLKDWSAADQAFLPLGTGDMDMADIVAALGEIGYDGWVTVELDGYDGDPLEAARTSARFLEAQERASA